jgi:hypothetical protein
MSDNSVGRPRKEFSDKDFEKLVAMIRIQCTQEEVCSVFDMTADTLNARLQEMGEGNFSDLYKKHQGEGKTSLRRMQWKAAEAGNPTMLVWLGKNMLGQSDKISNEHSGPDGQPLQVLQTITRRIVDERQMVIADESRRES